MLTTLCQPRDHPLITRRSLDGFSEDKEAARRYTRRHLRWSMSCVVALLCFAASITVPIYKGESNPVPEFYVVSAGASFAACIGLFVMTWRRMVRGIPVSTRSGQPMEVYRLEDTISEGRYELVYVCRLSRTYFTLVYGEPGD